METSGPNKGRVEDFDIAYDEATIQQDARESMSKEVESGVRSEESAKERLGRIEATANDRIGSAIAKKALAGLGPEIADSIVVSAARNNLSPDAAHFPDATQTAFKIIGDHKALQQEVWRDKQEGSDRNAA